ncbi:MAG: DoxX family membrane protein [Flavobacterium sp.]|nr:DoxX family membrane protein [Flavobacterium sp.]
MENSWHLYLMSGLYILAGVNHFRNPKMYIRIIPPYMGNPKILNYASGIAEILLGLLLLVPTMTSISAWGIIILLIAIFPANVYMATNKKTGFGLPGWLLWLRLPLQFALIFWAYLYT